MPRISNLYSIADLILSIDAPRHLADIIPTQFDIFRTPAPSPEIHLRASLDDVIETVPQNAVLLDETTSDLGRVALHCLSADHYLIMLRDSEGHTHSMKAAADFSAVALGLCNGSPAASRAVGALLRIAFSQAILLHGGVSVHASAVVSDGAACAFLGPSGTGKSTHARLWIEHIPGTTLLNDDNPLLRIRPDGSVMAYGSPWSGKTHCYRDTAAPLRAIVRLEQAAANDFEAVTGIEAFTAILPSCSAIKTSSALHGALCDTVAAIAETVFTGRLRCRPDQAAARLCHSHIRQQH